RRRGPNRVLRRGTTPRVAKEYPAEQREGGNSQGSPLRLARPAEGMPGTPPHPDICEERRALERCRIDSPADLTGPRLVRRVRDPPPRRRGRDEPVVPWRQGPAGSQQRLPELVPR